MAWNNLRGPHLSRVLWGIDRYGDRCDLRARLLAVATAVASYSRSRITRLPRADARGYIPIPFQLTNHGA
jgi:hypothetical protein